MSNDYIDNMAESAAKSMVSAMSKLLEDTENTDIIVNCGEKEWRLHSCVLAIRSPFFKREIVDKMECSKR